MKFKNKVAASLIWICIIAVIIWFSKIAGDINDWYKIVQKSNKDNFLVHWSDGTYWEINPVTKTYREVKE